MPRPTATLVEVQRRLAQKYGDLITIDPASWVNSITKSKFFDAEYGEFEAFLGNVLQKQCKGHPIRGGLARGKHFKLEEIRNKVSAASGDKVEFIGPYLGMLVKTKFRDLDFGEFEALPANVIHKRTRHPLAAPKLRAETMLKNFGFKHHMQNEVQFLKHVRSRMRRYHATHWRTGTKVLCIGTWELKVIEMWNHTQTNYDWQPKAFTMPNGRTYRPDAYLPDQDLWIEIKGRWLNQSKEKWDWFHSEYPNSELWNHEKLKELNLL